MTKTIGSTRKGKILAKRLLQLHREVHSWRKVAKDNYPGVNYATLNRIARSKGEWMPKSFRIQELLGIARKPRNQTPLQPYQIWWRKLLKAEREQMIRNLFELEGSYETNK